MINEYFGKVVKTFHDTTHNIYYLDVNIEDTLYKLEFKHYRAYVVDDGDFVQFKGIIDEESKKITELNELWVKLK